MSAMNSKAASALALILLGANPASGQIADYLPPGMEGVGIDQLLDEQADLGAVFTDEKGNRVTLADYCDGTGVPVVLTFNFSDCQTICSPQLEGLVSALRDMDLTLGDEFHVVTVSLDPNESYQRAKLAKKRWVGQLERPEGHRGWHFLTGEATEIRKLADSVGYRYKYVNRDAKYSHQAALILLTPTGRIARYFAGSIYQPTTLHYSLVEASEGTIGSITDGFFLSCFRYDAASGKYTLFAQNFMKFGAALTVLALAIFLFRMRKLEPQLHGSDLGAEVAR